MQRILTLFILTLCVGFANIWSQNLIQNGAFELGGPGNGFIVDGAGYNMLNPPFSGATATGNYAFSTNAALVNNTFLTGGDHTSGAGIMMIIDGNTIGGQQRFYKAGSTGGGVCGLSVGQTYTFFYWIRSISSASNAVGTRANIGVQFNNTSSFQIQSGSTLAPLPNAGWQQVVYQFTPSNSCVNIELFNNNASATGNDFAIDDLTVNGPPNSLQFTYSLVQAGCGSPTNCIAVYAKGGTAPYSFSITGATSLNNTSGLFNNLLAGNYNITVTDANNATISISNVLLSSNPSASVLSQDTTICLGQSINLITSNPISLNNWLSSPNDPSLQSLNNTTYVATPSQTTTYALGSNGNSNLIYNNSFQLGGTGFFSDYQLSSINPGGIQGIAGVNTNAQAFFNPFANCSDQDGTGSMLVVDGSTQLNAVLWRQIVPVQPNTNYNLSYWATSVVNFSPAQLQIRINGTTLGSTTLGTSNCNWQNIVITWNSGVANFANIEFINANLASQGNDFAVDNFSFMGQANCDVVVTVLPSSPLNIAPQQTFCIGDTIFLTVPNSTNLVWQTPSGSTSITDSLIIPNAQLSNAGVYSVSVLGGGTCSLPTQTNVVVSPGPDIITTVQDVLCNGQNNGSITANPIGNGPFSYSWSTGSNNQGITMLAPENYTVQVTDVNGCISTASALVGNPAPIEVNIDVLDTECNQSNGSASAIITGGTAPYSATWSNGTTGLSASNYTNGNHSLTVFDANNCQQSTNFSIGLLDGPNPVLQLVNATCFGENNGSATITVTGGNAPYTFTWTPNVSNSFEENDLIAGSYEVVIEDDSGCEVTVNFLIEQPEALQFSPTISNPTCGLNNGSISLNVTGGTAGYVYDWQPNISITESAGNLASGSYAVEISDFNGCSTSFSTTLQTQGTIPLTAASNTLIIQIGDSANLGVLIGGGITNFDITWSPADDLDCSNCQFPQAGPVENTTYIATVTTPDGCLATSSILVIVDIPCINLFLPSIFSPNNDGLNDAYCVLGTCLESLEFAIFNRWGEQVFSTNDQESCWDGKFRGNDAPQGVYAYKYSSTDSNGKVIILSGNITLVR